MSTLAATNLKNPSSATNNVVLATNGDLQFNSGYGSAATAYGCRAWVNFNGQGSVAIRASGNVSSITDNGVGDYTVNFTTAMVDANYNLVGACGGYNGASSTSSNPTVRINAANLTALTTTTSRITTGYTDGNVTDWPNVCVSIFR